MTALRDDPRVAHVLVDMPFSRWMEVLSGLTTRHELLTIHRQRALDTGDMATAFGLDAAIARCAEAERRIREAAGIGPEEEG